MDLSAAQLAWLLNRDLAEHCGEPTVFPKGVPVYLLSRAWLCHFRSQLSQSLPTSPLDFSSCPLDNSDLFLSPGVLTPSARDHSVLVSESEFLTLFRGLAAHPDHVLKLYTFYTHDFHLQLLQFIPISYILKRGNRLTVSEIQIPCESKISEMIAILPSPGPNQTATYWNSLLTDTASIAHQLSTDSLLIPSFSLPIKPKHHSQPCLSVLQTFTIILEFQAPTEKSLFNQIFDPLKRKTKPVKSIPGLVNLGNTCFLNSVVQVMAYIPQIAAYCHVMRPNGRVFRRFAEVVRAIYANSGQGMGDTEKVVINPAGLREALGEKYRFDVQQDADEVLFDLISGLSDGIPVELPVSPYLSPSDLTYFRDLTQNYSYTASLFTGLQATSLICDTCSHPTLHFSPFLSLPIQLTSRRLFTVYITPFPSLKPRYQFTISVQAPIEHDVRISSLRKSLENRLFTPFLIFTCDKNDYKGPLDLSSVADLPAYYILETPDSDFLLWEIEVNGELVALQTVKCELFLDLKSFRRVLVGEMENLADFVSEKSGFLAIFQRKKVTNEEKIELQNCQIMIKTRENDVFLLEEIAIIAKNISEIRQIFGQIRIKTVFPRLPQLITEFLTEYPEKKSLSERDFEPVVATLPQLVEFTLSSRSVSEKIDCTECKTPTFHSAKSHIERFPVVTIFHIIRVKMERKSVEKDGAEVCYPDTGLDLRGLEQGTASSQAVYDLTGVIRHTGDETGGHYLAYVKHPLSSCWFKCDDSEGVQVSLPEVLQTADILLYLRR